MTTERNNELPQTWSDVWWIVLLRGIIAVVLGIVLFIEPASLIAVFMLFLGAYWFVDGFLTLTGSIMEREKSPNWRWGIFAGIIGILAGLVVFSQPIASAILTTAFLTYFLAAVALIYGFSCLMKGIRLRKAINYEWSMIIGGALSILFGIFLISSPLLPMLVLAYGVGAFALISGIVMMVDAFRLRRLAKGHIVSA